MHNDRLTRRKGERQYLSLWIVLSFSSSFGRRCLFPHHFWLDCTSPSSLDQKCLSMTPAPWFVFRRSLWVKKKRSTIIITVHESAVLRIYNSKENASSKNSKHEKKKHDSRSRATWPKVLLLMITQTHMKQFKNIFVSLFIDLQIIKCQQKFKKSSYESRFRGSLKWWITKHFFK